MNSHYRWVIVATGAFMGCVAIGSIFSLPVFLQPMSAETGWSRTEISLAMTLNFIAMGVAGFGWGMMMDRSGPRIVLLAGSSILGLGLTLASRSSTVGEFQLLYGVLVGVGGGAIFAPLMATVTGWFDRRRSLAVSLVSAGMGVAPMTVAPIAADLVSKYDWRFAQLLIGISARRNEAKIDHYQGDASGGLRCWCRECLRGIGLRQGMGRHALPGTPWGWTPSRP
jgi:MFS family permease